MIPEAIYKRVHKAFDFILVRSTQLLLVLLITLGITKAHFIVEETFSRHVSLLVKYFWISVSIRFFRFYLKKNMVSAKRLDVESEPSTLKT